MKKRKYKTYILGYKQSLPIIAVYRDDIVTLKFYCVNCNVIHYHGTCRKDFIGGGNGLRASHCHTNINNNYYIYEIPKSTYHDYFLKQFGGFPTKLIKEKINKINEVNKNDK